MVSKDQDFDLPIRRTRTRRGFGGVESDSRTRLCDYQWVLGICRQCIKHNIPFHYKQTGALFRKDGKFYRISRNQRHAQACKAALDYRWKEERPVL